MLPVILRSSEGLGDGYFRSFKCHKSLSHASSSFFLFLIFLHDRVLRFSVPVFLRLCCPIIAGLEVFGSPALAIFASQSSYILFT
jgi:hypothetical protein